MKDDKQACCVLSTILGVVGGLTFIICFSLSWDIVELGEMAFCENLYQPQIYSCSSYRNPGYHFTGLDRRLIMVPSTNIQVPFTGDKRLAVWSKDGANVYIDISFYYKLDPAHVVDFYKNIGKGWRDHIVRLSYADIKEVTVQYTTTEFYSDRITIGAAIKTYLNTKLFQQTSGAVTVTTLQLRKITFDAAYENAINSKLIQAHLKKSYENQQQIKQTNKNTDYIIAGLQNQIDIALNDAYSTGNNTLAVQKGTSQSEQIQSFNTRYGAMMSSLSITNQQIQPYIYAIEQILLKLTSFTQSTVDTNARSRAITSTLQ